MQKQEIYTIQTKYTYIARFPWNDQAHHMISIYNNLIRVSN